MSLKIGTYINKSGDALVLDDSENGFFRGSGSKFAYNIVDGTIVINPLDDTGKIYATYDSDYVYIKGDTFKYTTSSTGIIPPRPGTYTNPNGINIVIVDSGTGFFQDDKLTKFTYKLSISDFNLGYKNANMELFAVDSNGFAVATYDNNTININESVFKYTSESVYPVPFSEPSPSTAPVMFYSPSVFDKFLPPEIRKTLDTEVFGMKMWLVILLALILPIPKFVIPIIILMIFPGVKDKVRNIIRNGNYT